ncbi:hypothetical protein OESDEN_05594 [Oesophagostomum dentatum]|uniref:Uncharacterized protein n=1 Tax=Oesophagostomum dentatum TaxID=61180 RepID=A0A0B1TEC5_OESDE|nr:hypothetical protein OESDEN_05594 [Oesophagostomum dentatum]
MSLLILLPTTVKLILLCFFLTLYEQFTWARISSQDELPEQEFFRLLMRTNGIERELDVITLEDGSTVRIKDVVQHSFKGLMVQRYAAIKLGTHSSAKLQLPNRLSNDSIDTSKWKIDKTYIIPNSYYNYMIDAIFRSDGVRMSRDSTAKVLSIGLGGGTIDGFLHAVFPKMDITVVEISPVMVNMARKWFGLSENYNYRVKIADGVDFLAEKANSREMYDVILLDACLSDQVVGIVCPYKTFLNVDVLENISKLIHPRGIFVINALSMSMAPDALYDYLAKRFHIFFNYCGRLYRRTAVNQVIYCMHRMPTSTPHTNIMRFLNETV